MITSLILKSILHNIGVIIVGFIFAFIGSRLDSLFGLKHYAFFFTLVIGVFFLLIGFLIRVWATFQFYEQRMKVVSLKPQKKLITSGAFRFSRNPLYLGGNIFIFFGADLLLGSLMAIVLTILNIILLDLWMIPREEKQLEKTFGKEWIDYKKKVRRWF